MESNRFFDQAGTSRHEILYAKLKQEVFRLLENKVTLTAHWNAGGDETPGGIDFYPESASDPDMGQALFWAIVSILSLPNAGEAYDEGSGEIYRGEDNSLRLRFTSRERTYGTEKQRDDEVFVMPIGELLPLRELSKDADIYLSGSMNDFGTVFAWVRATRDKKQIELGQEQEEIYKEVLESVLHSYSDAVELVKVENSPDEYVGGSVRVDFKRFTEDNVEFDVSFSYELVFEHKDENVVLIDANDEPQHWKGRKLY